VTRKKEVIDWQPLATVSESGIEDCENPYNLKRIQDILQNILDRKNEQFKRAVNADTVVDEKHVVALKTSDFGFVECVDEVHQIASDLLSDPNVWPYVHVLWLLPDIDISDSRWISG
jgi:hypothetical protein